MAHPIIGLWKVTVMFGDKEFNTLIEMYPGLKDEDDRRMYMRRLERQIKKVDRLEDYSYEDLKEAFELVLEINDQTVKLDRELIIYEFFEKVLAHALPGMDFRDHAAANAGGDCNPLLRALDGGFPGYYYPGRSKAG